MYSHTGRLNGALQRGGPCHSQCRTAQYTTTFIKHSVSRTPFPPTFAHFELTPRTKHASTLCSHRGSEALLATQVVEPWQTLSLRHVIESQQFDRAALDVIFATAIEMEAIRPGTPASKQLDGVIMSTLFYEPSTRTRLSFESAMARLGGTVLSTESAGEYSSAAKGETLEGLPTPIQTNRCLIS